MTEAKVLIIDDCAEDRQTLCRYLRDIPKQQFDCSESELARDGYALCAESAFDLVLLDWRLPDEDGLDVLLNLKQDYPALPIVMISAFGDEDVAVEALQGGATDYINKQKLSSQRLKKAIDACIQYQKQYSFFQNLKRNQNLLSQLARQTRSFFDLTDIYQTAVDEIRDLLSCDRVVLCQFDPDKNTQIVAESVSEGWPAILGQVFQDNYFQAEGQQHYCSGRRQIADDISQAEISECHRNFLDQLHVKSNMVLPILTNGRNASQPKLWGLLAAHHCANCHPWQPHEVQCFEEVTIQLAIAIQQAELLFATQQALEHEQKLNTLKSQFITTVSHEYRSPLATILAAASTLKRGYDGLSDKKRRRFLSLIEDKVHFMTSLVDNLLTIHKIEADQIQFSPKTLDLKTLITQLIEMALLRDSNQRHIELKMMDDCEIFYGDPGLIHIIVDNLISNALKYSPTETEVIIKIKQTNGILQISVCDHGIGIPQDELDQVFKAFQRGSNVDVLPGTGVGLAIVQKCTQLHQGSILVESTVNQGSQFTVKLPILNGSSSTLQEEHSLTE